MTVIQRFVFPDPRICEAAELFYRQISSPTGVGVVETDSPQVIRLNSEAVVEFDRYFNALSVQKWNELCDLKNIVLSISIKGEVHASVIQKWLDQGELHESLVWQGEISAREQVEHSIRLDPTGARGIWCLRLEAGPDDVVFYQGHFQAESASPREVNLATVMCTYKREAFVHNNIELLTEQIFDNPNSSAREHIKLFLVDNAGSIAIPQPSRHIAIISNRNTGGAGGFTRGLIEAHEETLAGKQIFTHCLFLDDDITLHPESLERLIALLRLLKPEYASAFINGAMLKAHDPTLQQEKRAIWNGKSPEGIKQNIRLTNVNDILGNEYDPEPANTYVPWWFCCFPIDVSTKSLPFPFFVRGDDIEYSLRHSPQVLSLNGICVWHEAFERKPGEFMRYYFNTRNYLVIRCVRARRPPRSFQIAFELVKGVLSQVLRCNYLTPRLILKAHHDFLRGTAFFRNSDPQTVLTEVTSFAEKWTTLGPKEGVKFLEEHAIDTRSRNGALQKALALIFLNGHLLPSACLTPRGLLMEKIGSKGNPGFIRSKTLVVYDQCAELFTTREISRAEFVKIMLETVRAAFAVLVKFRAASNDYRQNFDTLTTKQFWKFYLGL